jgi:alkanesulfonate monooxygenase SsuD/methylene tetrahydromethanopterin reductase-like flavin-dependent oxidoreductase (luciferase family)
VFVLAMRNPFLAAKAIATAAVLSHGRVTLTLGVGWSNVEYTLLGRTSHARGAHRRDDRGAAQALDRRDGLARGHLLPLRRARVEPECRPCAIPIWVGGISDAALRRAARNDGWLSDLQSSARSSVHRTGARFRAEQGRGDEPFDVMASASDAFTLDGYRRLAKIGVTHVLTLPWVFTHGDTKVLSEKKEGMRRFADDVIAKL